MSLDSNRPPRGAGAHRAPAWARVRPGRRCYLRAAAYSGFRPPTLNELYRPFRVGNDVTEANAELVPERLYGAEIGAGGSAGIVDWSATAFYNRLADAVTNVTLGFGPARQLPVAGFIPAGGVLLQRQNVGAVNAYGLEAGHLRRAGADAAQPRRGRWTPRQGRRRIGGPAAHRPRAGRVAPALRPPAASIGGRGRV